ncbi:hypothetical protein LY78DRAFT_592899 [Colletotrichum sublineola]|nr:hypothetical protein LY78DRAFT_592899 [Colletotrichum sublineola]
MRYSLVFFLVPAIAAPQRPTKPVPVAPLTGGLCCSSTGIPDPSGTCSGTKADGTDTPLNSYCCSAFPDWSGNGCDGHGINGFPIGRDVITFPPGGNDGSACGFQGFIGCAL